MNNAERGAACHESKDSPPDPSPDPLLLQAQFNNRAPVQRVHAPPRLVLPPGPLHIDRERGGRHAQPVPLDPRAGIEFHNRFPAPKGGGGHLPLDRHGRRGVEEEWDGCQK